MFISVLTTQRATLLIAIKCALQINIDCWRFICRVILAATLSSLAKFDNGMSLMLKQALVGVYIPTVEVQFKCNVVAATNYIQTFVNDHLFKFPLAGCSLNNFLINGVCSHKTIHNNWLHLTNPVTAILSLQIHLRILTNYKQIKQVIFN